MSFCNYLDSIKTISLNWARNLPETFRGNSQEINKSQKHLQFKLYYTWAPKRAINWVANITFTDLECITHSEERF